MKYFLSFIVIPLFATGLGAPSFAAETYALRDPQTGKNVSLDLIDKDTCLTTLAQIFSPELVITSSLAALNSINSEKDETLACLENVFGLGPIDSLEGGAQYHPGAYKTHRLLARFHAYLKKGGDSSHVETFCQTYEDQQRRDSSYSKMVARKGVKSLEISIFGGYSWKFAEEYGLTEGELGAIWSYLSSFYETINPALWQQSELEPDLRIYKEMLDAALDHAPNYSGDPVVRFANLPPAVADAHQVGKIVTYPAYTSTSSKKDWKWKGAYRFLIFPGPNAKDLSKINFVEDEVLFKAGTRFKVLSRKGGLIVLAEVNDQGKVVAKLPPGF